MKRISLTQGQFAIVDDEDLIGRSTPDGDVTWTCWKCHKVFKAHCGLDILNYGEVEKKK